MKFYLFLELKDGIKIFVDKLNWVLQIDSPNNRLYYPTLDALCDDLLEIRLTKELSKNERENIFSIIKSIRDARETVRDDMERLENTMTNADTARRKGVFSK